MSDINFILQNYYNKIQKQNFDVKSSTEKKKLTKVTPGGNSSNFKFPHK